VDVNSLLSKDSSDIHTVCADRRHASLTFIICSPNIGWQYASSPLDQIVAPDDRLMSDLFIYTRAHSIVLWQAHHTAHRLTCTLIQPPEQYGVTSYQLSSARA